MQHKKQCEKRKLWPPVQVVAIVKMHYPSSVRSPIGNTEHHRPCLASIRERSDCFRRASAESGPTPRPPLRVVAQLPNTAIPVERKPSHGDPGPRGILSSIQKALQPFLFPLIGDEDCGERYASQKDYGYHKYGKAAGSVSPAPCVAKNTEHSGKEKGAGEEM
jgi:hypothetical protein